MRPIEQREKWNRPTSGTTYLAYTIDRACNATEVGSGSEWFGNGRASHSNDTSYTHRSEVGRWSELYPRPTLDPAALHGVAGDFVRLMEPGTEADPAALLAQFLSVFGTAIGPSAHFITEADKHTARIFVLVVGETSGGRKGVSKGQVDRVYRIADNVWLEAGLKSGLATGEGLMAQLQDKVPPVAAHVAKAKPANGAVFLADLAPPKVEKLLSVYEPEFARTLSVASREGNTLNAIIRDAWDTGRLQSMTRKDPMKVTGAHVSNIGHITHRVRAWFLPPSGHFASDARTVGTETNFAYIMPDELHPCSPCQRSARLL